MWTQVFKLRFHIFLLCHIALSNRDLFCQIILHFSNKQPDIQTVTSKCIYLVFILTTSIQWENAPLTAQWLHANEKPTVWKWFIWWPSLCQIYFKRPQEHHFRKPQLSDSGTQNKWAKNIQCGWKELLHQKEKSYRSMTYLGCRVKAN